jgi:hypothetical protein
LIPALGDVRAGTFRGRVLLCRDSKRPEGIGRHDPYQILRAK